MISKLVKVIVTVPEEDADKVREAIGKAGGGMIGNYSYCSFSMKGIGRFIPEDGANPTIGEVGTPEQVIEERVEVSCQKDKLNDVISAIKKVHPYEEPVIDVYSLL